MKYCCACALFVLLAYSSRAPAQPTLKIEGAGPFDTYEKLIDGLKAFGQKDLADAVTDTKLGADNLQLGDFGKAETHLKRALAVIEDRFPDTALVGAVSALLAATYIALGDLDRAEKYVKVHLRTARNVPKELMIPDEQIALSYGVGVSLLATILEQRGDYAGAERSQREVLVLWEKQFPHPDGHFTRMYTLTALARIVTLRGDYESGEALANRALVMLHKLAEKKEAQPLDPIAMYSALNTLAAIRLVRGTDEDRFMAEQYQQQAIAGMKKLFPKGHPFLATMVHNRAITDFTAGNRAKVLEQLAESREMLARFYPGGHPDLCQVIRDQGYAHAAFGDIAEAERYTRDALAMADTRLPGEHPVRAHCLTQAGYLALRTPTGAETAARLFREAAQLVAAHTTGQADLLSEADALNLLRVQFPSALDGLLSATAGGPLDPRDYQYVWASKAAVFRALERRHRSLLASRDPEARELADQLESARSELAAKLLAPRGAGAPAPDLAALSAKKEDLERRLNARLQLGEPTRGPVPHPFDLARHLPENAVFVDFVRYNRVAPGPGVPGLTDRPDNPHYAAFVSARGQRPRRVELGPAKPIDTAVEAWRAAIAAPRGKADERGAAREVARLMWVEVAKRFPPAAQSVYLAPDGPLARVPFAALPGRGGVNTILLEEAAVAVVPHGRFLLDRLAPRDPSPPREGKGQMLIVGGVDYRATTVPGVGAVPALTGTDLEAKQIEQLARETGRADPVVLTGEKATTAAVLDKLPVSRYAHIATHGFFAGRKSFGKFGLDPLAFAPGPRDLRTAGARNPLALHALVLAGAADPNPVLAQGLLTAEALAGRRLAGMDLAVLSACETGLGEEIGGEGAYGFQRAFHLTGCRTVVASLWEVDDATARELMSRFYRYLWTGGADMTPAKALRAAQLDLYRSLRSTGEAVPRLPVKSKSPAPPPPPPGAAVRDFEADAYSWAVFVVSGAP